MCFHSSFGPWIYPVCLFVRFVCLLHSNFSRLFLEFMRLFCFKMLFFLTTLTMMKMITLHFPRKKTTIHFNHSGHVVVVFSETSKKEEKNWRKNYQRQKQNARTNAMCFFRLGSIFLVSPITIYSQKKCLWKDFYFYVKTIIIIG